MVSGFTRAIIIILGMGLSRCESALSRTVYSVGQESIRPSKFLPFTLHTHMSTHNLETLQTHQYTLLNEFIKNMLGGYYS